MGTVDGISFSESNLESPEPYTEADLIRLTGPSSFHGSDSFVFIVDPTGLNQVGTNVGLITATVDFGRPVDIFQVYFGAWNPLHYFTVLVTD